MLAKLAAGAVALIVLVVVLQSCLGGDGGGGTSPSVTRPSSIPTATPPANLPEPIVLGQSAGGTSAPGQPAGSSGGGGDSYDVKSGDTLGAIATSLGIAGDQQSAWIADVLRLNGMQDARQLAVGQKLTLPRSAASSNATPGRTGTPAATGTAASASGSGSTPTRTSTPPTSAQATSTPQASAATPTRTSTPSTGGGSASGKTYTVQSGDYPYAIADKLNVPDAQQAAWVAELVSLNKIDPSGLSVGQVLQLPASTP